MGNQIKNIVYLTGGITAAYILYSIINKGFSFIAKYPKLYYLVTKGESKTYNDYNFYNSYGLNSWVAGKGKKYPSLNRPLTSYTVGQIKKMQAASRSGNGQLWATGRYQIIPSTLIYLQKVTGISDLALYNKITQDRLANALIKSKPALYNYLEGKVEDTTANLNAAALAVAQIWSSVGMPGSNRSYYGENATTDTLEVQKILKQYRKK